LEEKNKGDFSNIIATTRIDERKYTLYESNHRKNPGQPYIY